MISKSLSDNNGSVVVLTVLLLAVATVLCMFSYDYFFESGSVTGDFVSGETSDYGVLCGQYPSSLVILGNFSFERMEPCHMGTRFYFDSYDPKISSMTPGHRYRIDYTLGYRPSDVTSWKQIKEFYITGISEVD